MGVNAGDNPFPLGSKSTFLGVTEASANKRLPTDSGRGLISLAVDNVGSKIAYVMQSPTSADAVAVAPVDGTPSLGKPVQALSSQIFTVPAGCWIAAICAAGDTTTLVLTPGQQSI